MKERSPGPNQRAFLDLAILALAGLALRIGLSMGLARRAASGWTPCAAALIAGALLACGAVLWVSAALLRRGDWAWYPVAALLLILIFKLGRYRPEIAPVELPLAAVCLAPAGVLIWQLVRKALKPDELERRILSTALLLAFAVQFTAALVCAFLEGGGFPRPSAIVWAALLAVSWSVGLIAAARRYA